MNDADGADGSRAGSNFRQGVRSAATAGDVGSLFQYVIATPVTLPRQQSAMLPIVNADVKGEKVSIYNPARAGEASAERRCGSPTRPTCT